MCMYQNLPQFTDEIFFSKVFHKTNAMTDNLDYHQFDEK